MPAPFLEIPQEWHWRTDTGQITPQRPLHEILTDFYIWITETRPDSIEIVFKNRCDIYKVTPIPDDEEPDFEVLEGHLGTLQGGQKLEAYLWSKQPGTEKLLRQFQERVKHITKVKIPKLYFFENSAADLLGKIVFPSETIT